MHKKKNSFDNLPDWLITKWQEITDLLSDLLCVPATLIMKTENEYMEVFISSKTENNPYNVGDKEKWYGLYCETVIKTQEELLIPNALIDKNWDKNPDIKLGMVSYLGFPINFPDNQHFGTICVLDNKENQYSENAKKLLLQFKNVIELDLALIQSFELKTKELTSSIVEQQSEILNKNKELEQFTYITSHDLQEPLNSIISFSLLLEGYKENLDKVGQKSIEIIKNSSYRMKDFITSLLEYSRIGKVKEKTEVDIKQLIEDLKTDLHDIIAKNKVRIDYIGNPLKIKAFKTDLIKLFQNLIVNGIKYTDEETMPIITIDSEEQANKYKFTVTDNGIGIDKKQYEKVFEVFQRLHSRDEYSGTGIGLSHCKKVVELHKGKIWLTSEVGKGTSFYFTISKQ
jgi:signal transduction histidine kinase